MRPKVALIRVLVSDLAKNAEQRPPDQPRHGREPLKRNHLHLLRTQARQDERRLFDLRVPFAAENTEPDQPRVDQDDGDHDHEQRAQEGVQPGIEDERLVLRDFGGCNFTRVERRLQLVRLREEPQAGLRGEDLLPAGDVS